MSTTKLKMGLSTVEPYLFPTLSEAYIPFVHRFINSPTEEDLMFQMNAPGTVHIVEFDAGDKADKTFLVTSDFFVNCYPMLKSCIIIIDITWLNLVEQEKTHLIEEWDLMCRIENIPIGFQTYEACQQIELLDKAYDPNHLSLGPLYKRLRPVATRTSAYRESILASTDFDDRPTEDLPSDFTDLPSDDRQTCRQRVRTEIERELELGAGLRPGRS